MNLQSYLGPRPSRKRRKNTTRGVSRRVLFKKNHRVYFTDPIRGIPRISIHPKIPILVASLISTPPLTVVPLNLFQSVLILTVASICMIPARSTPLAIPAPRTNVQQFPLLLCLLLQFQQLKHPPYITASELATTIHSHIPFWSLFVTIWGNTNWDNGAPPTEGFDNPLLLANRAGTVL
jgi:hypothetical protein